VSAVERSRTTLANAPQTAGAVKPAATGNCYDNPTCENSIWPGRGKRVLENCTVQQCLTAAGAGGAWKGAVRSNEAPYCYPLAGDGAKGLLQREQLNVHGFKY
jgi:hypothetical protein